MAQGEGKGDHDVPVASPAIKGAAAALSCFPGPLTLQISSLLCCVSKMQVYNSSETSLYNAAEEVIKTYL